MPAEGRLGLYFKAKRIQMRGAARRETGACGTQPGPWTTGTVAGLESGANLGGSVKAVVVQEADEC